MMSCLILRSATDLILTTPVLFVSLFFRQRVCLHSSCFSNFMKGFIFRKEVGP